MFNFIIFLIYFYYANFIKLSLLLAKFFKIRLIYTNHYGYGDFVLFCNYFRNKVNSKNKIFCFSNLQYKIARFFFKDKFIYKSLILMPEILNESHLGINFLNHIKNFNPRNPVKKASDGKYFTISHLSHATKESMGFIHNRIRQNTISNKVRQVCKKKTICLYIKTFNYKKNNHLNFQTRQTRNLKKIYDLIYLINKKKINLIILGNNKDQFIKSLPKKISQDLKYVYLFKDISKDYSIADQAYVGKNSYGYIGSGSGANVFFNLLNKKLIYIDAVLSPTDKYWKKTITFIYKKVKNIKNNKVRIMKWEFYDEKKFKIIENRFCDIKKSINKKLRIQI